MSVQAILRVSIPLRVALALSPTKPLSTLLFLFINLGKKRLYPNIYSCVVYTILLLFLFYFICLLLLNDINWLPYMPPYIYYREKKQELHPYADKLSVILTDLKKEKAQKKGQLISRMFYLFGCKLSCLYLHIQVITLVGFYYLKW